MMIPLLTVVIPTYNRPEHLKTLVDLLLPQRDLRWKLLIVDNHSTTPVRNIVPSDVEVFRNPVNIGPAGNYPRCFEMMTTEWVWMIGDDDLVDPDAVDRVLSMIALYPDAAIVNFGAHGETDGRAAAIVCTGFDGFLTNTDSVTKALWMSGNVYRRSAYWPYIDVAYRYANTCSSHFVLLMMALLKGGVYVQLPRAVCRPSDNVPVNDHSELITTVMGLADVPMTRQQQRKFAALMQREFVKFTRDVAQCAFHFEHREGREELLYKYSTRWTRWSIARGSLPLFLAAMVGRLFLGSWLGRKLIRGAVQVKEVVTGRPTTRRPHVPPVTAQN